MNRAPKAQAGLALGAWGAVQATAAGVGMALSGALRDLVNAVLGASEGPWGLAGAANGYVTVYLLEIALLVITITASIPLIRGARSRLARGTPEAATLDARPDAPQAAESPGTTS
jgi:BCD family chlorophyll transporter-like MFS transporter